jgi:hypothetical protein
MDVKLTNRDVQIMARQMDVMRRQNGDLAAALAHAEAVNQQLVMEFEALKAELAKKGKKG